MLTSPTRTARLQRSSTWRVLVRGITIDADGMVYVADSNNNRVQKFTPEGKLLAVIDSKGKGGGRLNVHMVCVSMIMAYFM